ncbi:MAG: hypothetical protein PHS02_02970, partial [Candidatus ainarchaeum sp.]|nr:hypothetical protein [Candidatus ainarchaeum sp.]
MLEKIKAAAEHIRAMEDEIKGKAAKFRSINHVFVEALEKELVHPLKEIKVDGLVGAVDGGLLAQEMHG